MSDLSVCFYCATNSTPSHYLSSCFSNSQYKHNYYGYLWRSEINYKYYNKKRERTGANIAHNWTINGKLYHHVTWNKTTKKNIQNMWILILWTLNVNQVNTTNQITTTEKFEKYNIIKKERMLTRNHIRHKWNCVFIVEEPLIFIMIIFTYNLCSGLLSVLVIIGNGASWTTKKMLYKCDKMYLVTLYSHFGTIYSSEIIDI